jgi:hypothetical protein
MLVFKKWFKNIFFQIRLVSGFVNIYMRGLKNNCFLCFLVVSLVMLLSTLVLFF